MKKSLILLIMALAVVSCSSDPKVRFERGGKKQPAGVLTQSRSEPIFYNGKNYQLDYNYVQAAGAFDMRVSGMGPKQKQDAVNVATSALAYYSCPNGTRGRATSPATYDGSKWHLQAKCG